MKLLKLIILFALISSGSCVFSQNKSIHLEIGDSLQIIAFSKSLWNETDLFLRQGETYCFTSNGQWTDWYIVSDANGYEMKHMNNFRRYRRSPENKWFALMGAVDKSDNIFLIGRSTVFTIENTGKFYCFANDVKGFYFNNKGSLMLKIKRIK